MWEVPTFSTPRYLHELIIMCHFHTIHAYTYPAKGNQVKSITFIYHPLSFECAHLKVNWRGKKTTLTLQTRECRTMIITISSNYTPYIAILNQTNKISQQREACDYTQTISPPISSIIQYNDIHIIIP